LDIGPADVTATPPSLASLKCGCPGTEAIKQVLLLLVVSTSAAECLEKTHLLK